jgi:hypothetical protein
MISKFLGDNVRVAFVELSGSLLDASFDRAFSRLVGNHFHFVLFQRLAVSLPLPRYQSA